MTSDTRPPRPETLLDEHVRRRELVTVAAFWSILAVLWTAKRIAAPVGIPSVVAPGPSPGAVGYFAHAVSYFGVWAAWTFVAFALIRRLPLTPRLPADGPSAHGGPRVPLWRPGMVAMHLGLAALVASGFRVWDEVLRLVTRPDGYGGSFAPAWRGARAAVSHFAVFDQLMTYAAVLAAALARDYFLRLQARQGEAARHAAETDRLGAQLAEARLSALRAQLAPHFLFNTLHNVSAMVERDPDGVRRMLARLSDLLRYALERGDAPLARLDDELDAVGAYLDIVQVRFGDRLSVARRVDPRACAALVPTLALQPLVENAVEHGVGRMEGAVRVELTVDVDGEGPGSRLRVRVRDTGPGLPGGALHGRPVGPADGERRHTGVGLANTRARLAELYGADAALSLRSADDGPGTVAELVLPFRVDPRPPAVAA